MLFALCPAASARDPEPKYEGKPLSYWLEKFQQAETDEQRQQASSIICAFGPDAASAVPLMVEMLHDHSENYRGRVQQMLVAVGPAAKGAVPDLIKMLERNPPRAAREVCEVLGAIGPDAKPALPAIRKVLLEQTAGEKRMEHGIDPFPLHKIGPEAAPILAEAVIREPADDLFTLNGLTAIAALGPAAKAVAPKLRPLLKSELRGVRMSAAAALGMIEQNAEVVTVLVKFIDDEESAIAAVRRLGQIGPAAKDALPTLKSLVKSDEGNLSNEQARRRAAFQSELRTAIRNIEAKSK
jgi:HEAT repeat protein